MLKDEIYIRDIIAQVLSTSINEVVKDHITRLSQEPQITSKIADRIETQSSFIGPYNFGPRTGLS